MAAYVRVSTDEQADKGNSIFEQQERLGAYCRAMGWDAPEYFIDDGFSAKNLKRPAVTKLLAAIESKMYDVIVVTKLDRMCRNLLDLLQLVDVFEKYECRFVSSSESFDTSTAAGRMTLHLLGMFAEFERERISERVKDNMVSLAKNTSKALSGACYGYDVIDGQYVINQTEAEHVRYMFQLGEEGYGTRHIAKKLNEQGIVTKKGMPWDSVNVKRLMKNEKLCGTNTFNKRKNVKGKTQFRSEDEWIRTENNHEAIITQEQFELVQHLFESRRPTRARAENETYLLSGLIHCKRCGKRMKGHTARTKYKTYYKYVCSSYVLSQSCGYHAIDRDELEAFIIHQMQSIAKFSDDKVEALLKKTKSDRDEKQEIKVQLAKLDKRMQKQLEAYENDLISAHDLKLARERVEAERMKLTELMKSLDINKKPNFIQQNIVKHLSDIMDTDRIKAKKSMSILIDRVEIDTPVVDIIWRA